MNYNFTTMDSFKIGDTVIYPNQGLGIIEDIKKENYYGEEFRIYHVRLLTNNTLVLISLSNAKEIGIRKPIPENSIVEVFNFIRNGTVDVTMNWKGRYKEHVSLMKTGSLIDTVLVLKSLYYLNLIKPLSFREKKMMEKAKGLIVSELSEVASIPREDIEKKIIATLSKCYKNIPPRVDS